VQFRLLTCQFVAREQADHPITVPVLGVRTIAPVGDRREIR
jgi:hypothetical protein